MALGAVGSRSTLLCSWGLLIGAGRDLNLLRSVVRWAELTPVEGSTAFGRLFEAGSRALAGFSGTHELLHRALQITQVTSAFFQLSLFPAHLISMVLTYGTYANLSSQMQGPMRCRSLPGILTFGNETFVEEARTFWDIHATVARRKACFSQGSLKEQN